MEISPPAWVRVEDGDNPAPIFLAAEGHFHSLNRTIHECCELVVADHHTRIIFDRFGLVLEDRPAGRRVEHRRDEIAFASRYVAALLVEILSLDLAPARRGGEFTMHIGEFSNPHPDGAEVADGVGAGRV
jgi:hypothetical protein